MIGVYMSIIQHLILAFGVDMIQDMMQVCFKVWDRCESGSDYASRDDKYVSVFDIVMLQVWYRFALNYDIDTS